MNPERFDGLVRDPDAAMSVKKYTRSYSVTLNVELSGEDNCSGCPLLVQGHEIRCGYLNRELPRRQVGNYSYLGRLKECPLVKSTEERYSEPVEIPVEQNCMLMSLDCPEDHYCDRCGAHLFFREGVNLDAPRTQCSTCVHEIALGTR